MQERLRASEQLVSSKDKTITDLQRTISDLHQTISDYERRLEQGDRASQQKDKTITDLQRTISDYERRLEQGDRASKQQPVTMQQSTAAVAQKNISKMSWRNGKIAPQEMFRGAAIVHGNTAYIRPNVSKMVYAYQNIGGEERWSLLPVNPNENFGLVVIDGVLTSVGGEKSPCCTNELLSLREIGKSKQWSEILPSMPTRRHSAACVTTKEVLVAIGGSVSQHTRTDIVEVMDIETKQWTEVSSLLNKYTSLSATICGDELYLAGGTTKFLSQSGGNAVFTCSLPDILQSKKLESTTHSLWKEISSLSVTGSTLVTFCGCILAIGGRNDSHQPTPDVYKYNPSTDSWTVTSKTLNSKSWCFAVCLPEDLLVVVGGVNTDNSNDSTVQYLQ